MSKTIFITGATGLVGQNIIPRILAAEPEANFILLIRGNSDEEAKSKYSKLIARLIRQVKSQHCLEKISSLRGDVAKTSLGLDHCSYQKLLNSVTHIIHAAADVRFNLPLEEARRVNVGGTMNVLELASSLNSKGLLSNLAHIGTAFISGRRRGVIYEQELDCGQQFSNTYERSKFEAECRVRSFMPKLPITIFRPSIIVGDSITGATSTFNVIYRPLRMIGNGLVRFLPGSRKIRMDIVPVDFVCDSICHIMFKWPGSAGKIYHLTAGRQACSSAGEIVNLSISFFNQVKSGRALKKVFFFPAKIHRLAGKYYPERYKKICRALSEYEPYLTINRIFDNSNTLDALRNAGITVPVFKDYYRNLLQYCVATGWGKLSENA